MPEVLRDKHEGPFDLRHAPGVKRDVDWLARWGPVLAREWAGSEERNGSVQPRAPPWSTVCGDHSSSQCHGQNNGLFLVVPAAGCLRGSDRAVARASSSSFLQVHGDRPEVGVRRRKKKKFEASSYKDMEKDIVCFHSVLILKGQSPDHSVTSWPS